MVALRCSSILPVRTIKHSFPNRSPLKYSMEQMSKANIFGIVFCHAKGCVVKNCRLMDSMNEYANNGCPAVSFLQSRDCSIINCFSKNVTFVKSVYSDFVTVSGNYCENSVGTCIESICGKGGQFDNNYVKGIYWDVSCVGVNSMECKIENNVIYSASNNTSCLTLGHRGYNYFSASGTVVDGNTLSSDGVRAILVQNGSGMQICNNTLSCAPTEDFRINAR